MILPGASNRSNSGMIAGTMTMPMTFALSLEQIGPVKGNEKQMRRLYVGGIPETTTVPELEAFFNKHMQERELATEPGASVLSIHMNTEKQYAFVEVLPLLSFSACACVAESRASFATRKRRPMVWRWMGAPLAMAQYYVYGGQRITPETKASPSP